MSAVIARQRRFLAAALLIVLLGSAILWMLMRGDANNPPPADPRIPAADAAASFREEQVRFASGGNTLAFAAKNIAYDGRPILKRVKCPVLVFDGERDTIVPAQQGAAAIKDILTKAGNPDVTIKTLAEADHFLHLTKTGGPREMLAQDRMKVLAPGYLSTLTVWLGERLATLAASPARAERARRQIREGD
jgi:pimeloyl-ACP methyl ester carboxylesterase